MQVLVACEESQEVCKAFRELGHEAYSCDIEPCSGGHPEWHIWEDVLPLINGDCSFRTMDGVQHNIDGKWDLLIAHPPCTYLTLAGNKWFKPEYKNRFPDRVKQRENAVNFFMMFANADCKRVAIENPVCIMSSRWRKPDQYIEPYYFGEPYEKRTCLWLINLPLLQATDIVKVPPRKVFSSGKTMPAWYADLWNLPKEERAKQRSKTFPGIAKAMAEQWSAYIEQQE